MESYLSSVTLTISCSFAYVHDLYAMSHYDLRRFSLASPLTTNYVSASYWKSDSLKINVVVFWSFCSGATCKICPYLACHIARFNAATGRICGSWSKRALSVVKTNRFAICGRSLQSLRSIKTARAAKGRIPVIAPSPRIYFRHAESPRQNANYTTENIASICKYLVTVRSSIARGKGDWY